MNVIVRSALVFGCLGIVGLGSGCGGPSGNGTEMGTAAKGDPALIIINPILFEPPLLSQVAPPTGNNGATCGSTTIAIPTSLASFDCSYGVQVLSDPDQPTLVYAWACHPVSSSGETIDDAIQAVYNAGDANVPTAFGGPPLTVDPPHITLDISTTSYTDTCFGAPDAGYVIVAVAYQNGHRRPLPCPGDDCESGNGGDTGSGGTGGTPIVIGTPVLQI